MTTIKSNTPKIKGKAQAMYRTFEEKAAQAAGKKLGPKMASELMALIAEYRETREAETLEAIFSAWEAHCKRVGPFYLAKQSGHTWASELLPVIEQCRATGTGEEAVLAALEVHYKVVGEFYLGKPI
jgi:hypothetical protein